MQFFESFAILMIMSSTQSTPAGHAPINVKYLLPICLTATLGGLLFGYDTGVISGAIEPLTAKFELNDVMKGWASGCVLAGCALGVLIVGPLSDRFGRKLAMLLAALMFLVSAIGTALPPTIEWFIWFRILGGIGIGIASISTPMYIAEITPGRVRGRIVSVNQIAIAGGISLVAFVNFFLVQGRSQDWIIQTGWRWMFATGVIPAILFLCLIFLLPESPRWMAEKKQDAEALDVLRKVGGEAYARAEMQGIKASFSDDAGSWRDLIAPGMMRPMILGISLAILQQVTGINVFMYFGATIFKTMSQSSGVDAGLLQQIVINGTCVLFTLIAIASVDRWGRKPLMMIGSSGMFVGLLLMGLMAQFMPDPSQAGGRMLACIILYIACFGLSVGPVVWVILAEIYPTSVRGRALGIATFCLWVADYVVTQTFPMMDKNERLVAQFGHAFPFYVYAFFCIVLFVLMFFVPETKGKSLEQIELSWKKSKH
jgi:sugar porter (SP) family MFS transporter